MSNDRPHCLFQGSTFPPNNEGMMGKVPLWMLAIAARRVQTCYTGVDAPKTSQKVCESTDIGVTFNFCFISQAVLETWRSKYVSTHLEHPCEASDCEAGLSFNLDLGFMSCFLKMRSGFGGVSFLKRKLYFPLCRYILEEGAFLSFLVSPPLLLHLCCSVGSFIVRCVGGVGTILKAEAINL